VAALVPAPAAAVALATAGTIAANTRQTTLVEFDGALPDAGFCDFPALDMEQGTYIVADQFDNDGVLFRQRHSDPQREPSDHCRLAAGRIPQTVRRMGVSFAISIPGKGIILLQTGYFEWDYVSGWTISAGPHDLLEGNFDALCAARA
jgi:hypothetical protein